MRLPRRGEQATDGYLPEAQEVMENAARTFSLAARLLPATVRDDVVLLYLVLRQGAGQAWASRAASCPRAA